MVNTSPGPDAAQILRPAPLETLVSKKTLTFWIVLLVTLVIDQATKFWVYLNLELYKDEVVVIPGLFSVVHAQNPGAAFSVLSNFEYRQYVFLVVIAVAIYIVAQLQRELSDGDALRASALGLIMGGAIGNGIDRIHKQTVTDFARFYLDDDTIAPLLREWFGTADWPSFNVADATLLIGVIILLIWGSESTDSAETPKAAPPASA